MPRNRLGISVVLAILLAAGGALSEGASAPAVSPITLEANEVVVSPDGKRVTGKGRVSLEAGDLALHAESLALDFAAARLELWDVRGRLPELGLPIRAESLSLVLGSGDVVLTQLRIEPADQGPSVWFLAAHRAKCKSGVCTLSAATASACPHVPPGYNVEARSVVVHESGDVDLTHPILRLGDTKVAALPWIRLRPPGKVGFLPPRLGWDKEGGFVAGPAGYLPLGDAIAADGHVAIRTSQGFETYSHLAAPGMDLSLEHLLDYPDNHGRYRMVSRTKLSGATLATDIDIASSRRIVDDLARAPLDRATTHTASRVLLASGASPIVLETSAELLERLDPTRPDAAASFLMPTTTVALTLPATPVTSHVWTTFGIEATRFGLSSDGTSRDVLNAPMPPHTAILLTPRLDMPAVLGPVRAEATAASEYRIWLPDSDAAPNREFVVTAFAFSLSVPLERRFEEVRHRIEPVVRYRAVPWLSGTQPGWVVDDSGFIRASHGIEIGARTSLAPRGERESRLLDMELGERIDIPGLGESSGPAYLAGSLRVGREWLVLQADCAWDHAQDLPSLAGLDVTTSFEDTARLEFGGRWLGPGHGPHSDRPLGSSVFPFSTSPWPSDEENILELLESVTVSFTPILGARAGARVEAWPRTALSLLWYGLELRSRCGCLTAGITASHRPDSAVPDVMAALSVTDGAFEISHRP